MVDLMKRMERIKGVCKATYSFTKNSLTINYDKKANLTPIKKRVKKQIGKSILLKSTEKIIYNPVSCKRKKK